MYIPDDKIEEIRATADIVDVVGDYVRLKKSGSRYKGLCPFHDEKTPSFSVDPRQGLFYCFGCQKGGDLFSFVQEVEAVSFSEAARMLAERMGVVLPEQEGPSERSSEREAVYHALRFAARFFYHQLTQTDAGAPALEYLRDRGFTPRFIKRFGLGYAPDAWDRLLQAAQKAQVNAETLEKAGLVIARRSGDGHYDRYRRRLIFPLFSHVGKVLGFAGRVLPGADDDQPKYINSPETVVYHKSEVLYGLHQAKRAMRKAEEAVLVEGYTDVMALHQAGVEHAVASSGTALTEEQIALLDRYADRLLLLYDADEAGGNAALRAIDLILARGLAPYVVPLPDGEDPDTFVQKEGAEAFRAYLKERRQDFITFRYEQARRAGLLDTPEGEARVMRAVVTSIARLDDPLTRETYLRRASEVLGIPDIRLHEVMGSLREKVVSRSGSKGRPPRPQAPLPDGPPPDAPRGAAPGPPPDEERGRAGGGPTQSRAEAPSVPLPPERLLLRLMLEHGEPMVEFILGNMALEEFTEGLARDVVSTLLSMYEAGDVAPQRILDGGHGSDQQRMAASVMIDEYEPSENWSLRKGVRIQRPTEQPREVAVSAMTLLKLERVAAAIERVKEEQYRAGDDPEGVRAAQQRMVDLQRLQRRIRRREFLDWNDDATD